jgi:hypothetical protein
MIKYWSQSVGDLTVGKLQILKAPGRAPHGAGSGCQSKTSRAGRPGQRFKPIKLHVLFSDSHAIKTRCRFRTEALPNSQVLKGMTPHFNAWQHQSSRTNSLVPVSTTHRMHPTSLLCGVPPRENCYNVVRKCKTRCCDNRAAFSSPPDQNDQPARGHPRAHTS